MARLRRVETKHPGPGSPELTDYWRASQRLSKARIRAALDNPDVFESMRLRDEMAQMEREAGLKYIRGRGWELGHFDD